MKLKTTSWILVPKSKSWSLQKAKLIEQLLLSRNPHKNNEWPQDSIQTEGCIKLLYIVMSSIQLYITILSLAQVAT